MCARESCFDHEKFTLSFFILYQKKMDLLFFRKAYSYNVPPKGILIPEISIITILKPTGGCDKAKVFMLFNREEISVVILCPFIPSGIHKPFKPYAASVTSIHWR